MRPNVIALASILALLCCAQMFAADTPKKEEKKDDNPLAKFDEEKLIDPGYCFNEFAKAVASKDAKVAAAFLIEIPKHLQKLDLKKPADQETFIKALAKFSGAQADSSQKMHGMAEVKYTDKDGKAQSQRMELRAGVWKITGL
ncbi:MAG TPA: hypothetical protein VEJ63_14055 [Planctomycetota bacterium]|nr:hypothetical protein [Planctomycetota bacterium]